MLSNTFLWTCWPQNIFLCTFNFGLTNSELWNISDRGIERINTRVQRESLGLSKDHTMAVTAQNSASCLRWGGGSKQSLKKHIYGFSHTCKPYNIMPHKSFLVYSWCREGRVRAMCRVELEKVEKQCLRFFLKNSHVRRNIWLMFINTKEIWRCEMTDADEISLRRSRNLLSRGSRAPTMHVPAEEE